MKAENFAGKEVWELYDVTNDPTEVHDLAKDHPEELDELKKLFDAEAKANNAYPLINWSDLFPRFQDFVKALHE